MVEGFTVGVTQDFRYVTVNVPKSEPTETVKHDAFVLLLTAEQAEGFAALLQRAADALRKAGN